MNGIDVKEAMEQIHISEKMQGEIIMNIRARMENGNKRKWSLRRMAAVAAAFVLTAGIVSLPVQAVVNSVVKARMESVPKEEIQDIGDMIQVQAVLADGFSREYSDEEKERSKALWQEYENGRFPEKTISQADNAENVIEGTLCYIKATGVFNLPEQEMTDEEILEIIDFQHKMSYAIEQTPAAQEARAEYQAEEARLEKMVQDAGGISGEEAIEIAKEQLTADFGEEAKRLELMTDRTGNGATLMDVSEEFGEKADVAYNVGFGDPDDRSFTYGYIIDAADGSILATWK